MPKIITTRVGGRWCAEIDKLAFTRCYGGNEREAIGELVHSFPASLDLELVHEAILFDCPRPAPGPIDGLAPENASEPAPGLAKARRRHEPVTAAENATESAASETRRAELNGDLSLSDLDSIGGVPLQIPGLMRQCAGADDLCLRNSKTQVDACQTCGHKPITTSDPFLAECEHMASEWEGG